MKSIIRVNIIKVIERICIFLLINLLIVNHLGKNPKKGGNPPKDKKFIVIEIFNILLIFIELVSWFIKNILFKLKINVIFNVIII